MNDSRYTIIETDLGPMISESRVMVFDVLEAEEEGHTLYDICYLFSLNPRQVETALVYIDLHRERLVPILRDIQAKAAEREAYHRAHQAEILSEIELLPMTPKRQAFYDLLAKNRAERQR